MKEITKNQGLFIEGSVRSCLQKLCAHVASMRKDIDSAAATATSFAAAPTVKSALAADVKKPSPDSQAVISLPEIYSLNVASESTPTVEEENPTKISNKK